MAAWIDNIAMRFGYLPKRSVEGRSVSLVEGDKFLKLFGIEQGSIRFNADVALGMSAVYRCVWLIASMLATAPLKVYREVEGGGSEVDKSHPNHRLLNLRPNLYSTSFDFRQQFWSQVLIFGNAVVVWKTDRYGRAVSLKILNPSEYTYFDNDDTLIIRDDKSGIEYSPEDYLHFKDLHHSGKIGLSRLGLNRKAMVTQLRAEKHLDNYYEKGTFTNGYLTSERKIDNTEKEQISKDWDETYSGLNNQFKTPVLGFGSEYKPITRTNVESQLMEFLNFAPTKIYQIFGVPPVLASDTTKSTSFGSGIEDMFIQFRQTVILPMAVSAEQEINYKLFRDAEIGQVYVKHNLDVIERANYQNRMEGLSKGIQNGFYSPNDARKINEDNPYAGGEVYMVNGNMQRVKDVAEGKSFLNQKKQKKDGNSSGGATESSK